MAKQIHQGKNPAPFILAETLIGLDHLVMKQKSFLKGSPITLQVWLLEKLSLIQPPPNPLITCKPSHYLYRKIDQSIQNENASLTISQLTKDKFRFICPWWSLTSITHGTFKKGIVRLAGFWLITYIIPSLDSYWNTFVHHMPKLDPFPENHSVGHVFPQIIKQRWSDRFKLQINKSKR